MPRQLDADLVEIVRLFRRRRQWRHVLAIGIGAVALMLGTAMVAARLAWHDPGAAAGTGAALYAAGALGAAWGAAGGFSRRLGGWAAGTLAFGVLAVLAFLATAAVAGESRAVSRRVLAAELLDHSDVAGLLGPGTADLQTPGASIARSTSVANWRAGPYGDRGAALSLKVVRSGRQAGRLRDGRRPPGARPVGGLPGGYAQEAGRVTRIRAGRGDWVVALQVRAGGPPDPVPVLAACADYVLDLLTVASDPVPWPAAA
jgi:hypothetical protein